MDAIGEDFDFAHALEGKQELHKIRRRISRRLAHNVADGIGDRGVKQHALHLHAGQVDTDELAFFEHRAILRRRAENCNALPDAKASTVRLFIRGGPTMHWTFDPVGPEMATDTHCMSYNSSSFLLYSGANAAKKRIVPLKRR